MELVCYVLILAPCLLLIWYKHLYSCVYEDAVLYMWYKGVHVHGLRHALWSKLLLDCSSIDGETLHIPPTH